MIKALMLIFRPVSAWDRVGRAGRGGVHILILYLLPLLVTTSAVEGYGLARWGKWQREVEYLKRFPAGDAFLFEIGQILLSLIIVLVGAWMVKSFGETFHGRHTFRQAFTTVAYGLSPLFTLRLLDAFPGVNPWLPWCVGILLSIGVLYQGVPRVMQPDPPHAFGLYLTSAFLLTVATGLARFITAWYLQGRFSSLEALIHRLGSRLPFP